MDTVIQDDCDARHDRLDASVERAIKEATSGVKIRLQLWILGAIVGLFLASGGGFLCMVSEVGAYRERVDQTYHQLEELKGQVQQVRDILLQRHPVLFTGP